MNNDNMLRDAVSKCLEGKRVDSAFVGAGSILIVSLFNDDVGTGEHYYSISVNCAWRIREGSKLLTTWRDMSGTRRDTCVEVVKGISGKCIGSTQFSIGLSDLCLTFEHGPQLDILIDISDSDESEENYYIRAGGNLFSCKTDGLLQMEAMRSS